MEKPRFDRSKDFGQIHPPFKGAMFQQGPHYFSGSEEYLFSDGGMRVGDEPSKPASPPVPKGGSDEDDGKADLVAWAKGEKNLPFFTVKKTVAAHWPDIDTANTKSIIEGLVEYGVVASEDVKR